MKKRSSLSAVSGRTCPHCLTIVDPVCYGWHVGKCSSRKLACTSKQDMALQNPIKIVAGSNSRFREAAIHVVSPSETTTLAPDSQIGRFPSSGDIVVQSLDFSNKELDLLCEENQTLKMDLKLKSEENEALNHKLKDLELKLEEKTGKVKSLELKLEDLKPQVKLVKGAGDKAACVLDTEKNAQSEEKGPCSQCSVFSRVKASGLINDTSTVPVVGNSQSCERQGKESDNVQNNGVAMNSASSDNVEKKLDRIVNLACRECVTSQQLVSHVEGVITAKDAVTPIVNTSRKQRILSGNLSNAGNEDEKLEVLEKGDTPCSADFHMTNLQDEFSPESEHLASHTSRPFQIIVSEEVPGSPLAPRRSMGQQCFREDSIDVGVAKVKGDTVGARSTCERDVGAQGLAPCETQHQAADTSLHAENLRTVPPSPLVPLEGGSGVIVRQMVKAQSGSSSTSTEYEINAVKAKTGFRRMVLHNDSESDSGTIQGIPSGKKTPETHPFNHEKHALSPISSDAVDTDSEGSCEAFQVKRKFTSLKASQSHLRRSKRLNMVHISDQSDDGICEGESEESYRRRAKAVVIDLEGSCEDDIPNEEHVGVWRSKRLRRVSIQKLNDSVQKEGTRTEKCSSSCYETNANVEGSEVSESKTSASVHSEGPEAHLKRKGPSRTRKRLFEDVESRPSHGKQHHPDSEDDDSEIESEDDSLKGFIADSEGIETAEYPSKYHSSSSSYSSWEVFCDSKHKRDIKNRNYVWVMEHEMVAMFEVDPELCLRAVCALNRRQTEDEQKEKASKYANKRGFDSLRAARGSRIAEFLTNGDVSGPVKKSLEELKKFDAGGRKFCKMLAFHHSRQLFEMYSNEEDPYFPLA